MKKLLLITLLLNVVFAHAQTEKEKLTARMEKFHRSLNDFLVVKEFLHEKVSYGHSNGWVQNKDDLSKDAGIKTVYHSFKEDSIIISIDKNIASVRFVADIDVVVNEIKGQYHLKVLEVWVKKSKRWLLFARQAVK